MQLSSNFTRTLGFIPHVRWRCFAAYAPGLVLGILAATAAWQGIKLSWFKPFIGVFLVLFLLSRSYSGSLRAPPLWIYTPLGMLTGFLSLFVGVTGPFIARFSHR